MASVLRMTASSAAKVLMRQNATQLTLTSARNLMTQVREAKYVHCDLLSFPFLLCLPSPLPSPEETHFSQSCLSVNLSVCPSQKVSAPLLNSEIVQDIFTKLDTNGENHETIAQKKNCNSTYIFTELCPFIIKSTVKPLKIFSQNLVQMYKCKASSEDMKRTRPVTPRIFLRNYAPLF